MIKLKDFINMCDISFLLYVYDEEIEGSIWEGYSRNLLRDRNYRHLLDCYITRWGMTDEGTNDFIVYVDVEL